MSNIDGRAAKDLAAQKRKEFLKMQDSESEWITASATDVASAVEAGESLQHLMDSGTTLIFTAVDASIAHNT